MGLEKDERCVAILALFNSAGWRVEVVRCSGLKSNWRFGWLGEMEIPGNGVNFGKSLGGASATLTELGYDGAIGNPGCAARPWAVFCDTFGVRYRKLISCELPWSAAVAGGFGSDQNSQRVLGRPAMATSATH